MADSTELAIVFRAIDQATATMKSVERSAGSMSNTFADVAKSAAGFAVGMVAFQGASKVFDGVKAAAVGFNSQLEQSTIAWKTFTGSTEAANAVLQQVQTIAASTPFEFEDVDKAAKRFVNMGLSAQQSLDFITPLSNAVASVGGGAAQIDQVSRAISQIGAKGKVSAEEINQLAEAGINGWTVLADAMGKPIPVIQKLAEQGQISSAQFNAAFTQFFGAGSKFATAAQDQAKSFQGSLSTISDSLKFVGATAFKPVFDALSGLAQRIASFVQSDQFAVWGARIQAVVGFIVDGLGGLAGAFSSTLGGVLSIVSGVGKSIYTALQWLNPFASHSPSLVSQVEEGVTQIEGSFERLGSASGAFDTVRASFENLTAATAKFSTQFGDDLPTKTEKALAIMGTGARAAFDETRTAIDNARVSLEEINTQWVAARDALAPLKDAVRDAKDALDDQKDALSGLKGQLDEAKDGYASSKEKLDEFKEAASQAERAIRELGDAQLAGTGEFQQKIAQSNIALKEQELAFSRLKQSGAYRQIAADIDAAQDRIRALQATEAKSTAQREEQRKAIQAQRDLIEQLKDKQEALLTPAQRELDKRKDSLDAIRLERDATIGLAEDRIKAASAAALGGKELTEQQVIDSIAKAKEARDKALAQVSQGQPGLDAQEAAIKALEGQIRDQEKTVAASQQTVEDATKAYDTQKQTVEALATSYREGKSGLADFDRQMKDLIQTADLQIQKAKEQEKAAKAAAKAGAGATTGKTDVLAGLDIGKSQAKLAEFQANVAQTRADVEKTFAPVGKTFDEVGKAWLGLTQIFSGARSFDEVNRAFASLPPQLRVIVPLLSGLGDLFRNVIRPAIQAVATGFQNFVQAGGPVFDFLKSFATNIALLGGALLIATPLIGLLGAAFGLLAPVIATVLSPIGLAILAIAGLAAAWQTNLGDIQTRAGELLNAFEPLSRIPAIIEQAFSGDVFGAIASFVGIISDVRTRIIEVVAGWAAAFVDWIIPLIPDIVGRLTKVADSIVNWAIKAGTQLLVTVQRWGDAFIGWITPRIPGILDALEGLARQIFAWVQGVVPKLISAVGAWATSFVRWIIPLLPVLLKNLEQIAERVIDWVFEAVPGILGALAEWAKAFLKWIIPLYPEMLGALAGLLGQLIVWIVEVAVPKIALGLLKWGEAFLGWIGPNVEPMIKEIGKLLERLGKWIIETALPEIGTKLQEWGKAFLAWVEKDATPTLTDELKKIMDKIGPWIHDQVINLATALGEWAAAFVNWITDPGGALDALTVQLPKILTAINDWIVSTEEELKKSALALGQWIVDGVINGVKNLGPMLGSALGDAWKAASEAFLKNFKPISLPNPFNMGGGNNAGAGGTGPAGGGGAGGARAVPISLDMGGLEAAFQLAQKTAAQGGASTPYIWGGAQGRSQFPDIFSGGDCSGFVAWIYNKATGKQLPAYVADLIDNKITTKIDKSQAVPGDLAIFNPHGPADQQHVGIFAGGNKMIDETTGGVALRNLLPGMEIYRVKALDAKKATEELTLSIANIDGATIPIGQQLDDLALRTGNARGSFLNLAVEVGPTLEGFANQTIGSFATAQEAALTFSTQFGIDMAQANAIIADHGAYAQQVMATDIPGAFALTDEAVEAFALKFGLDWEQARAVLSAGGEAAKIIMGEVIPAAAQVTTDAIAAAGNPQLWDFITSNAAIAGQSLVDYMAGTGASAINVATASLDTLSKASGLTMPQIQQQAEAAGKDVKTWLQDTAVPAAVALAEKLGITSEKITTLTGDAKALKKPVDEVAGAFDGAKSSSDKAKDAATQISAVLLNLRDGLYGKGDYGANGGLIQGIKDFIGQLDAIPRQIDINIVTHYSSTGSPSSGSPSGPSGPSSPGQPAPPSGSPAPPGSSPPPGWSPGASGPGGVWNDPGTGQPRQTWAVGGLVTRPTFGLMGESGAEAIMPLSGTYAPKSSRDQGGWTGGTYEVKLNRNDIAAIVDGIVSGISEAVPTSINVDDVVGGLARYQRRGGRILLNP